MRRGMIIGQPGSGKSTLARTLGQITDLPVIHIDQILWQTGGSSVPGPKSMRSVWKLMPVDVGFSKAVTHPHRRRAWNGAIR